MAARELYCSNNSNNWVNGPYSQSANYQFYGTHGNNDQQGVCNPYSDQINNTSWSQAECHSLQLHGGYVAYLTDAQTYIY